MKRLLCAVAALPFLAGVALAAQPVPLSDGQMDVVTAGFDFLETETTNTSKTTVAVDEPALPACTTCFLVIAGTSYAGPPPVRSFQVQSQFGP